MTETLEQAIGRLLTQRKLWLAVAESCTGGLLAHRITSVAGCSAYFRGGVIAYDNAVKIALLGVPPGLIQEHGAVSPETALAMAHGACQALQANLGLSVTGIAGPTGATATKPVGLAYVAIAAPGVERAQECLAARAPRDRLSNNVFFADAVLGMAVEYLEGMGNALCE